MTLSTTLDAPLVLSAALIGTPGRTAQHDQFTAAGNAATFTLSRSPQPGSLVLFVNGLFTRPGGYAVSGATLTFSAHALEAGDELDALYLPV